MLQAWDERFTHIDEEHFKKGERVEDWFPMDKELPKGILDEEKKDSDSEPEKGSDEEASGSDVEEVEEPIPGAQRSKASEPKPGSKGEPTKSQQSNRVWFCVSVESFLVRRSQAC